MNVWRGLFTAYLLLCACASQASSRDPGKVIAGWIEKITLAEPNLTIKAKMDTGAKTSSINARNVEQYKRDGKRWVKFDLVFLDDNDNKHTIHVDKPKSRRVRIKNTDGDHDRRAVVELDICFDGRRHTTEFTLADRSEYIYDVLLGREFLQGIAVIDPEKTFLTQAACPGQTP